MKKILVLLLIMVFPFLLCSCGLTDNGKIRIKHVSKFATKDGVSYKTTRTGGIILDMSEGTPITNTNMKVGPNDMSFEFKSLK